MKTRHGYGLLLVVLLWLSVTASITIPYYTGTPPTPTIPAVIISQPVQNPTVVPSVTSSPSSPATSINLSIEWLLGIIGAVLMVVFGKIYKDMGQINISIERMNKDIGEYQSRLVKVEVDAAHDSDEYKKLSQSVDELEEDINDIRRMMPKLDGLMLDEDIRSWDEGKMEEDVFNEKLQMFAWKKWFIGKAETSWLELLAHASNEGGLRPGLRLVIQSELDRLQRKEIDHRKLTLKEKDYIRRLEELLLINNNK